MATKQELVDDLAEEEEALVPMELAACFPDMTPVDPAVEQAKGGKTLVAGCCAEFALGLSKLLAKYMDVFRLTLGRDPPVDMPPLKVHPTKNSNPVRCKARRYSLPQREFMQKHVEELEKAGFIYRNPTSRWACAPLIVRKPHTKDKFRMAVDLRPVNSQTEQIAWPMPMLEVVVDHLRGATCFFIDSVAYCQSTVQAMFAEQLYKCLLAWLDDLLGYHKTPAGLQLALAEVLEVCAKRGLKLHPKIRVDALQRLPEPKTGADLQQYVCALNWMHMSIPGFNVLVRDLTVVLERVFSSVGGKRTKQLAATVLLTDVGWNDTHVAALEATKKALAKVVELSHPKPEMRLCVFADASEEHWGAVITQVPPDQLNRKFEAQSHEPLMFLSGTFTGAAGRWAIVEKEAYAIVVWADHLLHPAAGFNLYTDHRNLKFIINPTAVVASGSPLKSICAISQELLKVLPLRSSPFEWPTLVAIGTAQRDSLDTNTIAALSLEFSQLADHQIKLDTGDLWQLRLVNQVLWVPDEASELQLRPTLDSLVAFCWWTTMEKDVQYFVDRCLHCTSVSGGAPRPLGEALHSAKLNGLLHWDYLFVGDSKTGDKYLFVIKCDASKLVWLFPSMEATAVFTKDCLLQWLAVFGVCYEWVSDQASHHHFTTARCPWANGTVEVVMRQLQLLFRACLSEWRMATTHWNEIHVVVILIMNQLPSPSLGGVAPVTAMSGRPAMSHLDTIILPGSLKSATLAEIESMQRGNSTKRRDRARKTHNKKRGMQMAQFVVGDYVLYQDVWQHHWPTVVTAVASSWLYDVKNLITGDEREAHASRLKFYADKSLHVSEDFKKHVTHNSEGYEVEAIVDTRYMAAKKADEVLIKWRGLKDVENSW
ncbi:hypothetical protein H257_07229 [Aphanomyces astaci]|uniref:Chromo domain-containing protein n=1 Tax=Aphanomyces astaci TaxID=112090 RepID=W4GHL0_APHAT|nr:hypothetical protein H257_07229 [Aphanomyces astaci]ETV79142.1 hypothetical protein H257_07229 [Aphanomyces astaci]|eukprot:XP_009830983.1 hypothetical protein H257_07229 [Aphanomyces astaci]